MTAAQKKTLMARAELLALTAAGSYIIYWLITDIVWGWYLILTGQ